MAKSLVSPQHVTNLCTLFFQEESAEGTGHGLHHLHGHSAPAPGLRGPLQPLQAASVAAHEGLHPERCGGHHRRHVGPGPRWVVGQCCRGGAGGMGADT